jgi:hypothetical protein
LSSAIPASPFRIPQRRSEFTPGVAIKSDDVEGRTKIYESMVKGENILEAGTPASFDAGPFVAGSTSQAT